MIVFASSSTSTHSGNEIGPFRAVEESTLAHLTAANQRAEIYAWYSLIGTSGAAVGILSCGWVVHHLHRDLQWDLLAAYRLVFYVYAVLGLVKVALALVQSSAVEVDKLDNGDPGTSTPTSPPDPGEREAEPLIGRSNNPEHEAEVATPAKQKRSWPWRPLLPKIGPQSHSVIISLSLLFALDSFASGLAPL